MGKDGRKELSQEMRNQELGLKNSPWFLKSSWSSGEIGSRQVTSLWFDYYIRIGFVSQFCVLLCWP